MMKTKTKTGRNLAFALFCMIAFSSCNVAKTDLGPATDFLPDVRFLKDGIVNKYYFHYLPEDAYDPSTLIEYRSYLLENDNLLTVKMYDAAFQMTRSTQFRLEDNQMQIRSMAKFFRGDSMPTEVIQPVYYDWEKGESTTETKTQYPTGVIQSVFYTRKIHGDTIIDGRTLQVVQRDQTTTNFFDDQIRNKNQSRIIEYYDPDIGLFGYENNYSQGTSRLELIEQIPLQQFEEMAKHDVKRIAYIDSTKVMDKNSSFTLCEKQSQIVDYYNGQLDRAGFAGGKRALMNRIMAEVDKNKLHQESGFLTFRFVINCQGEAGWFVTEQADYQYRRKVFHEETIQHFFDIISNLEGWTACLINGEPRDAYFYLTIKLDQGEIIDLLP